MKNPKSDILLTCKEIWRSSLILLLSLSCSVYSVFVCALARQDLNDKMLRWWGETSLRLANVNLHLKGLERLPQDGSILVFNHMSLFDIIFIYACVPKRIRFGAKVELFRIPIFGQAMRLMGTLPIARQDKHGVLSVYSQAAVRTSRGVSFALAPEGTRQAQPGIGEFKSGPFLLAIEAQAPLIPIVIKGAEKVLSKKAWFISLRGDRNVVLEVLDPITTKGLTPDDRKSLRDQTRSVMQAAYGTLTSLGHHP